MAASPPLTGMPGIAPLKTDRAPGLEIEYATISAASVFLSVSVFLLHLLLVVSSHGAVEWSRW
jgi:hypothetical protein